MSPRNICLFKKKTKVSEIARYLTHRQSVGFWSTNIWPKEDPTDVDQSKYMIYRDVFPGKRAKSSCLCWEKSESIPSNIPSLGSLFQKIRYTEPTIGQLCLALGKAQTPWGAEIWNETFFLSVDLLQMLGQSKKNVFPNGGLTVSDLSWYKVIESQKKTNPSLCSKIQKKTSQEVAGWYRKISPKDKNPEMKRSVDYGISRSLRSWHLKKLSWGIQISSPLLPNLTFSLKRPKKERVPFPPQRGPLHPANWATYDCRTYPPNLSEIFFNTKTSKRGGFWPFL